MIGMAEGMWGEAYDEIAARCDRMAPETGIAPRECQVLTGLVAGLTEAAIADSLSISRHTVHAHVRSLYLKLGVHNRVQLFRRVMLPAD